MKNDRYFKALRICLKNDEINVHLLQRVLKLSYYQAWPIYKELKARGMIKKEKINKNPLGWVKVGVIDKEKLRQSLHN